MLENLVSISTIESTTRSHHRNAGKARTQQSIKDERCGERKENIHNATMSTACKLTAAGTCEGAKAAAEVAQRAATASFMVKLFGAISIKECFGATSHEP